MTAIADFSDSAKVEARLKGATNDLHKLADQVALARQVREFAPEQRRNLLARYVAPILESGRSAPQAEALARSSDEYRNEISLLEKQYQHAEAVIAKWSATIASYEAARSLLSFSKETLRQLDG
jgi:hypothetical protein